jgi:hypothetical protein
MALPESKTTKDKLMTEELYTWNELREKHPNMFVLVEAKKARSENGHRIVESFVLLGVFADHREARKEYRSLKNDNPHREIYTPPTTHLRLTIQEYNRIGYTIWPRR